MSFQSINPATGAVLETFEATGGAALESALARAETAWRDWRRQPYDARATALREAGRLLRERKSSYARTMALEMGKPLPQGEAEAEKCALACDYYSEHAATLLA